MAFVATADLTSGANLELAAVMASAEDARTLEGIAKAQLTAFVWAAQLKQLGSVVKKVAVSIDGSIVRFKAPLDMNDVNHLLTVLDGKPPAPAAGAGASAGSDAGSAAGSAAGSGN